MEVGIEWPAAANNVNAPYTLNTAACYLIISSIPAKREPKKSH